MGKKMMVCIFDMGMKAVGEFCSHRSQRSLFGGVNLHSGDKGIQARP